MGNRAWDLRRGCIGLLGLLTVGGCTEGGPPSPAPSPPLAARPQGLAPVAKVTTFASPSRTTQLLPFEDWLLMGLAPGSRDVELWRSDGTASGTQRLHQAMPAEAGGPSMVSLGARVLFTSSNEL